MSRRLYSPVLVVIAAVVSVLVMGCQPPSAKGPGRAPNPERERVGPSAKTTATKPAAVPKRYSYTPRPYPVDERGFSPVDKVLAKAFAREEMIADDDEGALNPYVMKVISAFPLDGSYPYHCGWDPREYDIYNGVTQDLWYRGMVVAKAYPDGSRCSYCCGLTFEIFVRAMKLRNVQKGLDADDFNGMTFNDLFNMLQLWYIEGKGDCEQRAITSYGLGRAITDFEQVRPGDFLSYSTTPSGGHSVIFIDWMRESPPVAEAASTPPLDKGGQGAAADGAAAASKGKIIGLKYFSSNLGGTHGVGYGQGRFSDSTENGRGLLRKSLRIVRVGAIKGYKPFDRAQIPARNAYAPTQPDRIVYLPAPATTQPVK